MRREKSLRIGVHHADAVVCEPVRDRTRLTRPGPHHDEAVLQPDREEARRVVARAARPPLCGAVHQVRLRLRVLRAEDADGGLRGGDGGVVVGDELPPLAEEHEGGGRVALVQLRDEVDRVPIVADRADVGGVVQGDLVREPSSHAEPARGFLSAPPRGVHGRGGGGHLGRHHRVHARLREGGRELEEEKDEDDVREWDDGTFDEGASARAERSIERAFASYRFVGWMSPDRTRARNTRSRTRRDAPSSPPAFRLSSRTSSS
eukprot:30898-Pelagococcus_subviridis.AAC.13